MKTTIIALCLLSMGLVASPAQARHHNNDGYYDGNGNWVSTQEVDSNGHYWNRVRAHKRRRNVLLGVGAVGLITHTGVLTGIGLGGAAANELIDHRHRDY